MPSLKQKKRQQEKLATWKRIANKRGEWNGKEILEFQENSGKTTF